MKIGVNIALVSIIQMIEATTLLLKEGKLSLYNNLSIGYKTKNEYNISLPCSHIDSLTGKNKAVKRFGHVSYIP